VFVVADAVGRPAEFWWDRPEIARSLTPEQREALLTTLRGDGVAITSAHGADAHRIPPASHRPADAATLRAALRRGIDLGVHSATHRSLPTLTDEELEYEVVASRVKVHEATGIWPEYFAYPYGRWDPRVRAMVHAAGYRAALTLDGGLNKSSADPWSLRRVNVPAGISDAAFEAWTGGLQARRGE
jgi:peptidoglycan/xylan/chitin deacetylase (PgdA/CDA1 family)